MTEAAQRVGLSIDTVQRWVDANEPSAEHPKRRPVAERERDGAGRPVPGRRRRPYRDAVEEWARQRAGQESPAPVPD